jgi:hypothetical protein
MSMPTPTQITTAAQSFSSDDLARRTVRRRAVEAAIWGMPLVNFDSMRQAYLRDAGARYNDVIYWSKPSDWKNQVTTPNATTNYVMFFVNLKDGPVVVEVPPASDATLFGTLIDAWNVPVMDVGDAGEDKGKGGKYLLLPPAYKAQPVAGYIQAAFSTFNAYALLRVIPRTNGADDLARAIGYLKKLKIYPLSSMATPSGPRFIDMVDRRFEAIPPYDAGFYASLARMVAEEPIKERDLAVMGQLRSLGIGKDLRFEPSVRITGILERSISEAHAVMLDGFSKEGEIWWPGRRWRLVATHEILKSKATFLMSDRVMVDERAFVFFGAFGGTHNPPPNLYVKTFEDKEGAPLNGSNTYRLRIPANVPTTQFWAVAAYDNQTAGFIREAPVVGLDSYNRNLRRNADGAVDIYLAPKAPHGQENNWISTAGGRQFFLLFRNYAPESSVLAKTSAWVLGDVEQVRAAKGVAR